MTRYDYDAADPLTLWDKNHETCVTFHPNDGFCECDYQVEEQAHCDGLEVHFLDIRNYPVATVFGAEPEDSDDITDAVNAAKERGDIFVFAEFGEHSMYWLKFSESHPAHDWDSGCIGAVVWPKEKWAECFPNKAYTIENVADAMQWYGKRTTADMNGWLVYADAEEGEENIGYGPFTDEEEAFRNMLQEFPACRYRENDFSKNIEDKFVLEEGVKEKSLQEIEAQFGQEIANRCRAADKLEEQKAQTQVEQTVAEETRPSRRM